MTQINLPVDSELIASSPTIAMYKHNSRHSVAKFCKKDAVKKVRIGDCWQPWYDNYIILKVD